MAGGSAAALLCATAAIVSCGGSSSNDYGAWLKPAAELPPHPFPVATEREAARVVRHQLEDHCGQRFIEARCRETAMAWECEYRSGDAVHRTSIDKDPPSSGEQVDCQG